MENKEEEDARPIYFHKTYGTCVYVPVSFTLFLLALTFPASSEKISEDVIVTYNLFVRLLLRVLPLKNVSFDKNFTTCHFTSRREMFDLVIQLHAHVLGQKLDESYILSFFSVLRANECRKSGGGTEASCVQTQSQDQKKPRTTCAILFLSQNNEHDEPPFRNLTNHQDKIAIISEEKKDQWTSEQAFCSCYFSAKWFLLHLIASGFPQTPTTQDRYTYHTFLSLFGKVLACFACRVNFQANLELAHYQPKQVLESNTTFTEFMYNLHNCVNNMLNKPCTSTISLQEVQTFFDTLQHKTATTTYIGHVLVVEESLALARFYLEP